MKRTDEQKLAFAKECLELEKAGGDVLGYIEVNWPSYKALEQLGIQQMAGK